MYMTHERTLHSSNSFDRGPQGPAEDLLVVFSYYLVLYLAVSI